MTTTPPPTAAGPGASAGNKITLRLSRLLSPAADRSGEPIGRVADIIVRLRGNDYPLVTGLVAAVGGREIFVPVEQVASLEADPLQLSSVRLDLRHFERRDGEVLLRADVLGHRLIDVPNARLVRAADLELGSDGQGWVVSGVDTRRRPRGSSRCSARRRLTIRQGLPRLARLRVADRPRGQRAAARPVRPDPPARAGPDRRPAGGGLQGGGNRDPRPGACRSRTRGRRLRGTRRGPGEPAARGPYRPGDRRRARPDARRRRRRRDRRAARRRRGSRCWTCCRPGSGPRC